MLFDDRPGGENAGEAQPRRRARCAAATQKRPHRRGGNQPFGPAPAAGEGSAMRSAVSYDSRMRSPIEVDPRIRSVLPTMDAPFFQAGLAGYSDAAMRIIARRHGAPYCITEALLDRILLAGGRGLAKADLETIADNVPATAEDHPLAGQIIGTEPQEMAAAGALLAGMGYDVIDVNLACPVRKIARKCRGGHFLAHPEDAIEVLKAVRDAVPHHIPTTVKLRRGSDDSNEAAENFERIFTALYDLGYSWATVHGRTVEQKYDGPSRWAFLRDLTARHPDKIIFGSGDIWTASDIFRMIEETGVHAVSVARGCIGNPWIFRQAREILEKASRDQGIEASMEGQEAPRDSCLAATRRLCAGERARSDIRATDAAPTPPTLDEQREVLLEHFALSVALHGENAAGKLMRKFGIKFAAHHPESEAVKNEFIKVHTTADWRAVIERWYASEPALA